MSRLPAGPGGSEHEMRVGPFSTIALTTDPRLEPRTCPVVRRLATGGGTVHVDHPSQQQSSAKFQDNRDRRRDSVSSEAEASELCGSHDLHSAFNVYKSIRHGGPIKMLQGCWRKRPAARAGLCRARRRENS
jgi:hypothetical protein